MTISTDYAPREIWMRYTDASGRVTYAEHRVWSAERLVAARRADAERENATPEGRKAGGRASATQITREQYLNDRGSKR